MKSLLLGSLLAFTASLFISGCSVEDTVKDIVKDSIKADVIYVVNGTYGSINVSVTSQQNRTVYAHNMQAEAYALKDHSSYTVSYNSAHSKSFSYGSTYLYAATTCNNNGYVYDKVNSSRVHVVNLTGSTFTDNIYVIDANGASYTITDNAGACGVTTSNQLDNIVIGNGMRIKIGNGNWELITGIPTDIVAIANKVKIDIVVYTTSTGTIVPMAGYDDLI